ncbi:hypothetical protein [Marinobacter sp. P4B1]|uniref:hypothetical protein n=1 Tax=Marinobacter sp. P4B1 TaxID=1119533 RepID=UPI0011A4B9B7|nr:hypothetical protein [Marinobacter sp. P4B1]
MTEETLYFGEEDESEIVHIASADEIKDRVKRLADEAWADHGDSYKAYLSKFGQLIESYVANTNEQTERGAIFQFACEYDYHMRAEIENLPDDLPPTLLPELKTA